MEDKSMVDIVMEQKKNEKRIHWGMPTNSVDVTLSDYRSMIQNAEKGRGMSFEQYTKKTQEWLQKNL